MLIPREIIKCFQEWHKCRKQVQKLTQQVATYERNFQCPNIPKREVSTLDLILFCLWTGDCHTSTWPRRSVGGRDCARSGVGLGWLSGECREGFPLRVWGHCKAFEQKNDTEKRKGHASKQKSPDPQYKSVWPREGFWNPLKEFFYM